MKPETRFIKIIIECQKLRDLHGFDYEEKCKKIIDKRSKEIQEKELVYSQPNAHFAKQLCIMNSLKWEKNDHA